MPIDSQVVNGRFVGTERDKPASLEIDQGRFISVDEEIEVWRTVDASGYYVLPGAVQTGHPGSETALALVRQGISSTIVPLNCNLDELAVEIDDVRSNAVLDFAVCWTLPADTTTTDVRAARKRGVTVFDVGAVRPDQSIAGAIAGAAVRIPADSPDLDSWLGMTGDARFVLTNVTSENLETAVRAKAVRHSHTYLETALNSLIPDGDTLSDAIESGTIDIVDSAGSENWLLQSLYSSGLIQRVGIPVSRLIELISTSPARAYGMAQRKGRLDVGCDADFAVFDPEQQSGVSVAALTGRVVYAQLRGEILLFNDELHLPPGAGENLAVNPQQS